MKWEYRYKEFHRWPQLNNLGLKGWEVVSVDWSPIIRCLLKRPLSKRKSISRKIVTQVKKKLRPVTHIMKATLAYLKDEWANS